MRSIATVSRWRTALVAYGLLAVGLAWGAGAARIDEADKLWKAGDRAGAVKQYQELVATYGARDDLTDEERLAYAGALINLAAAEVKPLADQEGADRRLESIVDSLTTASGARMLPEISHGQSIEINDVVAKDKPSLLYFGSPYCGPCMEHLPLIERLAGGQDEYHVVFVNVNRPDVEEIDWQSPVCKQFGLENLPTLKFYSPDGTVLAEDDAAIEKINEALGKMKP